MTLVRLTNPVTAAQWPDAMPKIVGRPDVDIAIAELKKIDVPHGNSLPTLQTELRETPYALSVSGGLPPEARQGVGWRRGRDSNPR